MPEELKTLPSPAQTPASDFSLGSCLSEDELLAFAQGELPARLLDRAHHHLDQCDVCQRLLAESARAVDVEPPAQSGRTSWNTVFQSNALIGKRYRILRLIGRGGMGEVYEAFDTMLHERVALKTVASTACDNVQAVRHLMAEVQLARRITHPNVCRIYDLGTHVVEPSGTEIHFLVMEFVEGECLGKRLRSTGALPLQLALSVARQLLLGLRAAHQAGILHRDFKSENVMLRSESSGQVTAIILDFGLARALNDNGRIATTQNHGQALIGTIGYMAPEQIEGEALTCSSDLYAFGVVWFEMLTGRLPFEAVSLTASAIARLHHEAVVPSSYNPIIPKHIDTIVSRCLSRRRAARYAAAEEVLDALAAAVPQTGGVPASEKARSRRGWYLSGALLLVTGLSYGSLRWHSSQPEFVARTWPKAAISTYSLAGVSRSWPSPDRFSRSLSTNAAPKRAVSTLPRSPRPTARGVSQPAPGSDTLPPTTTQASTSPSIAASAVAKSRPALLPLYSPHPKSEPQAVVD